MSTFFFYIRWSSEKSLVTAPAPGSRCFNEQGLVVTVLNAIMQHIAVREHNKDTVYERTRLHGCSRQKSPA